MKKKQDTSRFKKEEMALSKYIALAGVASRRKAAEIIKEGFVKVNNIVEYDPAYKVAEDDIVMAYNKLVKPESKVYLLLNKPKDYITTLSDEKGRKTVMELVHLDREVRLYPVGRLDRATTGLLLLTNDGDLALALSHPRNEVPKIYYAVLDKPIRIPVMKQLAEKGVELEDGIAYVNEIGHIPGCPKNEVVVQLHSGKNRIVRRLFDALGYNVKKLDRIEYAGLTKKGLRLGHWRHLENQEVMMLKKFVKK